MRPSTSALSEGRTPIVVGGTGLYLRAALADLDLPPAPPPGARERFEGLYDRLGPEQAHAALAERDPRAAEPSTRTTAGASSARSSWTRRGIARTPARPPLERETRHPTLIFGLDVPKASSPSASGAHGAMFGPGWRRRSPRAPGAGLEHREPDHRPARGRRAPPRGGDRGDRAPHAPIRGLPAQVDAPHPGVQRSPPTARRGDRGRDLAQPREPSPETASLGCRRFAVREMARARQRLSARRAEELGAPSSRSSSAGSATTTSAWALTGSSKWSPRTGRARRSSSGILTARRPSSLGTGRGSPRAGSPAAPGRRGHHRRRRA